MPLNPDAILSKKFPLVEQTLSDVDCMLYALSLGVGSDPMYEAELPYVFEENLRTFPTMPVVIGHPGTWFKDAEMGITHNMIVHGTQRLEILRPIPSTASLVVHNRNIEIADKGADKGAIVVTERRILERTTGELLARTEQAMFCRADGGFGGKSTLTHEFASLPTRSSDFGIEMPTVPNQALYYRLSGDRNPLHADPKFAARVGFPRPILHGLCSFGIAGHALLRSAGEGSPLRSIEARFSKPVYPGETLRFEVWREDGGRYAFRAMVDAREVVVLDRGSAWFFKNS
jgi:acyl dehydratase